MNPNPCEWKWYWPVIEWLSDECQCCAITRSIVFGVGIGLLIGVPWIWKVDFAAGIVLVAAAVVAAVFRTPLPKDEEPPQ